MYYLESILKNFLKNKLKKTNILQLQVFLVFETKYLIMVLMISCNWKETWNNFCFKLSDLKKCTESKKMYEHCEN